MIEQSAHQKKKIDAKELAEALANLPEEEKFKIFYMVKGIELINKNKQENEPVA